VAIVATGRRPGTAVTLLLLASCMIPPRVTAPPAPAPPVPARPGGGPVTTIPKPVVTTTVPSTTEATLLGSQAPTHLFVPEVLVEEGTATLAVEFLDGSTAELSWPADLDVLSDGVAPYGWAHVPHQNARDFFIRRGEPEEVVGLFGSPRLLTEYPDDQGGRVGFWRPEGWPDVDFLAFQFGSWVVLVYDYRTAMFGGDPMSDEDRQLWATHLHGSETSQGFLRLFADEPLQVAPAGAYPSPMSITMWSPGGEIDLVPENCDPGFVSPIDDGDEFSHWCDPSGLLSIRIGGPPDFAQQVHGELRVGNVDLAGETTSTS
jgi:hypothetical protein